MSEVGIENGEGKAKRTGNRVQMIFINEKSEEFKSPPVGVIAIKGTAVETNRVEILDLRKMLYEDGKPKDILLRLAAFGASVLGRNEVGTTSKDEPEEAADNLSARWEGFRNGTYRSLSTGSATPLIILAMERALREGGKDENFIAEKKKFYIEAMDEGEDEDAQKKSRAAVLKRLRKITDIARAEETIRKERAAARIAAKATGSLEDL